ncbi:MAG: phospholipase, partial [Clostridia bacterium]|nr:phospholipase [Clostridia bacterium]
MFDTKIGKYDCAVHLPPKKQEGLPLILYLHGAGVREEGTLLSLKTSKMLRCLEENPEYPAVVVAPLLGDKQNFWIAELPFLRELLDKATALYSCNPQRVFVTGASMGGFGTWYLAQRYPDRFAGIAPVCGGGMPWCAGGLKMPIRAFHGTEDTVVDVREST